MDELKEASKDIKTDISELYKVKRMMIQYEKYELLHRVDKFNNTNRTLQ